VPGSGRGPDGGLVTLPVSTVCHCLPKRDRSPELLASEGARLQRWMTCSSWKPSSAAPGCTPRGSRGYSCARFLPIVQQGTRSTPRAQYPRYQDGRRGLRPRPGATTRLRDAGAALPRAGGLVVLMVCLGPHQSSMGRARLCPVLRNRSVPGFTWPSKPWPPFGG